MEKTWDPLKVFWTMHQVLNAADVEMQNGTFHLEEANAQPEIPHAGGGQPCGSPHRPFFS